MYVYIFLYFVDFNISAAKLGSLIFSSNDWERLNKLAEKFNIPRDAFSKLYDVDRGFELDNAKINEIERERLSISVGNFSFWKNHRES